MTVLAPPLDGPARNERLIGWAGAAVFCLLAGQGLTVLTMFTGWGPAFWVNRVSTLHILLGFALVIPLAQKLAGAGYRVVRFYRGDPAYRAAGPPRMLLRVLAPVMVLLTVVVLATGVAVLLTDGVWHQRLEQLHRLGFFAWFAVTAVHVLAYVWRVPGLLAADLRQVWTAGAPDRSGAVQRGAGTLAAVGLGLAAALAVCLGLDVIANPF